MKDGINNAVIESTSITNDNHGCLSAWIYLDYGGSCQGFGGYSLYAPYKLDKIQEQQNFAGHFIWRVMEIAEVSDWKDLPRKTIRVRIEGGLIKAIGHIIKDVWYNVEEEFNIIKN